MDAMNMDTVCRLYEVGRQRLAEDEEDEEEDQVRSMALTWVFKLLALYMFSCFTQKVEATFGLMWNDDFTVTVNEGLLCRTCVTSNFVHCKLTQSFMIY